MSDWQGEWKRRDSESGWNTDEKDFELERQVLDLALLGATDQDICEFLGLYRGQLRRFEEGLIMTRARRRISLRRLQSVAAGKGNVSMLALLGKHELGQSRPSAASEFDEPEPDLEPKVG
jgi:hypothetical protein